MSAEQILRVKEEALRQLRDQERCCVIDQQGNIVLEKSGSIDAITFTSDEITQIKEAERAIFTHNHPGGWAFPPTHFRHKGRSFSLADGLLAAGTRLAEMRAVGPVYRFSLRPSAAGWDAVTPESVQSMYYAVESEVTRFLLSEVRAGRNSLDEANYQADHERWIRVAQRLGLRYSRWEE